MSLPTALAPPAALWRRLAPGMLLLGAMLWLFRDTAVAMVAIWYRSDAYAHAFLVPPIVGWLVWRRRKALGAISSRPAPWVLLPIAATCFVWLLGDLANINAATQFALVTLLILSVPALFGLQVTRALMFPLLFAYFAVPVGDFLVPMMIEVTADVTVAALRISGVPVLREGSQFVIPTGTWSVVDACSGVRYLIASFMVGTLFAYLSFRSPWRRAVFIVVSLLVPVVANWLRAFMLVMAGHLSNNTLGVGVDHIVYGWVFFGVVIGLMFMVGARWAEPYERAVPAAALTAARSGSYLAVWSVGATAIALLLATQSIAWRLNHPNPAPPPALELSTTTEGGWADANGPFTTWVPNFGGATLNVSRSFTDGKNLVGLWVAYYRDQSYERKLVTSTNTLDDQGETPIWSRVTGGRIRKDVVPGPMVFRASVLRGSADVGSHTAQRLRVWQVYWVDGQLESNDLRAKLREAFGRLLGRGDDGAALFFYAPIVESETAAGVVAADEVLGHFVKANIGHVTGLLEAARRPVMVRLD